MSDPNINNMPAALFVGNADLIHVVQSGSDKKAIASQLIASGNIASGSIQGFFGARNIVSGTIGVSDFGSGAILSGAIGSGQIGRFHISSGAITSGKLGTTGTPNGALFLRDDFSWAAAGGGLSSGVVGSGYIASGTVQGFFGTTRHITSGTIGVFDFGSGAILSGAIASGQVGTNHIGQNINLTARTINFSTINALGNSGTSKNVDWTVKNYQSVTMNGNCTFTFTSPAGVGELLLECTDDGTGGWTRTWPGNVIWATGTAPRTLNIGEVQLIGGFYDGTNYRFDYTPSSKSTVNITNLVAPADGDVANSTMDLYISDTPGSVTLKAKAKDSSAAVVDLTFVNTNLLATTSTGGAVILASTAETTTGTDTSKTITPRGLSASDFGKRIVSILVTDPSGAALTTGNGKAYYRIPASINGYNLVSVAASVDTASSSGIPTIQFRRKRSGVDANMLSTSLTIDANENDSSTAATPAVINASNDDVQTGDRIYVDITTAGTGTKGLNVELAFQLP